MVKTKRWCGESLAHFDKQRLRISSLLYILLHLYTFKVILSNKFVNFSSICLCICFLFKLFLYNLILLSSNLIPPYPFKVSLSNKISTFHFFVYVYLSFICLRNVFHLSLLHSRKLQFNSFSWVKYFKDIRDPFIKKSLPYQMPFTNQSLSLNYIFFVIYHIHPCDIPPRENLYRLAKGVMNNGLFCRKLENLARAYENNEVISAVRTSEPDRNTFWRLAINWYRKTMSSKSLAVRRACGIVVHCVGKILIHG